MDFRPDRPGHRPNRPRPIGRSARLGISRQPEPSLSPTGRSQGPGPHRRGIAQAVSQKGPMTTQDELLTVLQHKGGGKYVGRQSGSGPDADKMGVSDFFFQLLFRQCLGQVLDIVVTVLGEGIDGALMNAFQQQEPDF